MVELATAASVFFIVYIVARRVPAVFYALIAAYFLRFGAAVVNLYVVRLPDGDEDAIAFERIGWDLAQLPAELFWSSFSHTSANESYGWLVALPYRLVGRIEFVPQLVNVLLGTLVVYFVYRAVQIAWTEQIAIHAAWVTAIFPQFIHYSAVLMREAWIHLFLAVSVYYFVRYLYRGHPPLDALRAVFFSILSALLHGGMIVATLGLLGYFAWRGLRILVRGQRISFSELATLWLLVFLCTPLSVQLSATRLEFSSIGSVQELAELAEFEQEATRAANVRLRGGAAYPTVLSVGSGSDLIIKLIPRIGYLLFSPFPWDISEFYHIIGFLDGFFYLLLGYTLYTRWSLLRRKPVVVLLCVLVPLAVTFAIGTSNFGTGLRHRAKFFVVLLVLAGGFHRQYLDPRNFLPARRRHRA
jgi:4-amino-4-deoxy-L-arabinose transferase-like glycosyltransferase